MSVKTRLFLLTLASFALAACGGSGGGSSPSSSSAMNSSVSSAMSLSSEAAISSSEAEVSSSSDASVSSAEASSISSEGASSISSVEASSSSSSAPENTTEVGVFVDSAVIGITYTTTPSNLTGTTNEDGEYNFEEGDMVVFSIGDLDLPPVTAKGIVTPLDMADTDDTNNALVVNIARLLQSLDADGDPSNGITIPEAAAEVAAPVDFNLAVEAFAASEAVTNLVANSGSVTTTIISEEDALDHLTGSLEAQRGDLIGTWIYQDTTDPDPDRQFHIALIFLDEENYLIINDENGVDDDAGTDGFELGTYTWNLRTGVAEFTATNDTNGEWGFSHPCDESEVITLEMRGSSLFLQADGEVGEGCDEGGDAAPIEFDRVRSAPDELYGSWQIGGPSYDEFFVLTLTPNGTYFVAEDKEFDPGASPGEPGIERGTFTYDEETDVVLFTTLTDTNGQWGFSHSCASLDVVGTNNLACGPEGRDIVETLTPDGDNLIFVSEVDTILNGGIEEEVALDRVANYEGDLPMPTDATGTWAIDVVEDATACGAEGPESYTDVFSVEQVGMDLTVTDQFGTYEGYVNGYELNWSGPYSDQDGSGMLYVNAIFFFEEDDLKISGSTTWTFIAADDPEFTCEGSSEFDGLLTAP